jgi:hypothetical protein
VRRLDWFLAAVVVTFLMGAAAMATSNFAIGAVGAGVARAGGAGEVAMRRIVSRLPHPPLMGVEPQ